MIDIQCARCKKIFQVYGQTQAAVRKHCSVTCKYGKPTFANNREAFISALTILARKDPKVILIVGDVGFSYIEEFGEKFPEQFINVGVTEQSMMGIAAGMALAGWKPYVYSMIPFVTMRCYEQLRNDVCYHDANVKIIGVQGSIHYKFLGFSHNIVGREDGILLSSLPNIRSYFPDSPNRARDYVIQSYEIPHPTYIRL